MIDLFYTVLTNLTTPLTAGLLSLGILLAYVGWWMFRLNRSAFVKFLGSVAGLLGLLFVAASNLGSPFAVNNAMLQLLPSTQYLGVWRMGFTTIGDASPLYYISSNSACSLSSGSGDNGSQVKSADGKCWLASLPLAQLDARWWGAALNPVNMYTSPVGNDNGGTNYCFNAALPCTIQGALNQALKFNVNGGWVQLNLGSNTYTSGMLCNAPGGGGPVYLVGTGSGTTTIADASGAAAAVIASEYCVLGLQGVKITSAHGSAVFPQHHARIVFINDINIGTTALGQLHSETGAVIEIPVGYTISGGAPAALQAVLGGQIIFDENSITVTLSGTPAFSTGFADIEDAGSIAYVPNGFVSFSGSATGPRGVITQNANIETNSGSATYLPGSSPMQISNGGRYSPAPAPTVGTPTGLGSTGSAVLVAGSTDKAFVVQLSPGGTGIGSVVTIPLTFGASRPNLSCSPANLVTGIAGWGSQAVGATPFFTSTTATMQGSNNAVALTAGAGEYYIGTNCEN